MKSNPSNEPVFVMGAGGHAKVTIATLQSAGYEVIGIFDDNPQLAGQEVLGVPIIGTTSDIRHPSSAVIAIGNNRVRKAIHSQLDLNWISVVHPHAWVHSSVKLGRGTVVFAGAVIQPDVYVGDHVIVNTSATIDHDCVIHDFAHVGPGAHLAGNVCLGEGAFVGIGAAAIQNIEIGAWSTVGAGAIVVRSLPEAIIAVGIPARAIKTDR